MVASAANPETSAVARHIARAAARLFATRGYDATPVRAIVEAAGVTKPTLYYHFGSKEGLAQALLTVPMTGLVASLRGVLDAGGDPVESLVRMTEAHLSFCRDDPDRVRFIYALLFGPLGTGLAGEMDRFRDALCGVMVEGIRRLAGAGAIDPGRVEAFASAHRGLIVISTMDFLFMDQALGTDLAGRIVDDLLRGFGPGASDTP